MGSENRATKEVSPGDETYSLNIICCNCKKTTKHDAPRGVGVNTFGNSIQRLGTVCVCCGCAVLKKRWYNYLGVYRVKFIRDERTKTEAI